MNWNCVGFGDFPEDSEFCFTECPHETCLKCLRLQGKQYPLECWRAVAMLEKKNQEMKEAEAFACGHRIAKWERRVKE